MPRALILRKLQCFNVLQRSRRTVNTNSKRVLDVRMERLKTDFTLQCTARNDNEAKIDRNMIILMLNLL